MWLSDTSVKRPVFATVLSLMLIALGALAFRDLTVREYPDTVAPTVQVQVNYPGASSEIVETRVTQVLANLLKNAIEASPRGAVVRLSTGIRGERLELTVADEGLGIRADLWPRLFMPFATTKEAGGGHGLGLLISRELVLGIGGTLELRNARGSGCVARVTLPFET